jgi:hypothetical protein
MAINSGITKFEKYFLLKLISNNYDKYIPYLINIILNPKFKLIYI